MKLKDQVAVVTGAGRNIGEEIVRLLAAEGARVAVIDMDPGRGSRVLHDLQAAGREAIFVRCDIVRASDVQAMVREVVERFGGIDILVNNAAITDHRTILDITEAEFDQVIAVSLKGPFLVSKYVAAQMVAQGRGGKIVNIASTSGHVGRRDAIAYCAAKGGVLNLTRAMAVQLAPHRIRVNSISPNRSGSPVGQDVVRAPGEVKNLVGRMGTPVDQARAVLFLVSDESDFIDGANLVVDGGVLAMSPW
jgi:NAD(P)-dependent dehydrogenase (short-subunit alcohol dehydrogenase family)